MEPMEPHSVVGNLDKRRVTKEDDAVVKSARIAAKARANPKERFTSLLHHLTPALIKESLAKIPSNSATGTDGMTVEQAKQNLDWILPDIMKRIHAGSHLIPSVRRVHIPKPDGRSKPIGVPQVIDRAIQRSVATILNEIYEQDFLPCSLGFRPGLGCHDALAAINELMHRPPSHEFCLGGRHTRFLLEASIMDG